MNSFYKKAGTLILGTRMKRLSEKFLQEVNQVYKEKEISFEPSWFPIFYLLKNGAERSLTEIAAELDVSHSAISQMVTNLKKKGLLDELPDPFDGRRKHICLSEKGQTLLEQIKPVWWAMEQTVRDILGEASRSAFFEQLGKMEHMVQDNRLSRQVMANIPNTKLDFKRVDLNEAGPPFFAFLNEHELEEMDKASFIGMASTEQELIGVISFQSLEGSKEYLLQEFYIKNGHRRKGVGTQFLDWAKRDLNLEKGTCLHIKKVSRPLLELLLKEGKTFKVLGQN